MSNGNICLIENRSNSKPKGGPAAITTTDATITTTKAEITSEESLPLKVVGMMNFELYLFCDEQVIHARLHTT